MEIVKSQFSKSLAKYYRIWYNNAIESAIYCERRGDSNLAEQYYSDARKYMQIIEDNEEAIDFFSIGDNAFLIDSALPPQFRGYK